MPDDPCATAALDEDDGDMIPGFADAATDAATVPTKPLPWLAVPTSRTGNPVTVTFQVDESDE